MAGSPQWKVYTPSREYVAACKHASDAAALVSLYGDMATVRHGHSLVVWTEGMEEQPAAESYDGAANTMHNRVNAHNRKTYAKLYPPD